MRQLLRFSFLAPTLVIAFAYLIVALSLIDFRVVQNILQNSFGISLKIQILFQLFISLIRTMPLSGVILITSALLTGANLVLLKRSLSSLHLVVGGSSFLAIVSGVCGACGLSVLSVLGLGTSLTFLPLRGLELSLFSVILLLISSFYLYRKKQSCLLT